MNEIKEDFEEMIKQSTKVPSNFKLGLGSRSLCGLLKIFSALF